MIPIRSSYPISHPRPICPQGDVLFYVDFIAKHVHAVAMKAFDKMEADKVERFFRT